MYGYDTHSWRNSTEHRQMKRETAAATAKYLAAPRGEVTYVEPLCVCDAHDRPHDPQYWHGQPWPKVWTRRR